MGLFDFLKPKNQVSESAAPKAGNLIMANAITTAIEARDGPENRAGTYTIYGKTLG
jgi:hypothetical protein